MMDTLPHDVVFSIFLHLDRYTIGKVCGLNKKFAKICRNEHMWKQLTLSEMPEEDRKQVEQDVEKFNESWKNMYIELSTFIKKSIFTKDRIIQLGSIS
jgi:hypothetical protein